jgi:hypothetical protein
MKKYPFSRTGIITIVVMLVIGGIVLTGLHAKRKFSNLQSTTNREWVALAGEYEQRDVLAARLVEMASADPKFDKASLAAARDAQANLAKIQLNLSKPLTDSSTFNQYDSAQRALNSAMGKILRATLTNSTDPKTKRELKPLILDLVHADNEIAVDSNRFNVFAQIYNVALRKFPLAPYAGILGFVPQASFNFESDHGAVASSTGVR